MSEHRSVRPPDDYTPTCACGERLEWSQERLWVCPVGGPIAWPADERATQARLDVARRDRLVEEAVETLRLYAPERLA